MKKIFAPIFFMLILLAGCSNEPPVEVTTEKVSAVDGNITLTHSGTIDLSDEVEIRAAISGNVMEKFFEDGSDVTEGQRLFQISELSSHSDLLQSRKELGEAMTTLARELSELKRTEDLFKRNIIPAQEVADKRAAIETLQADIAEKQALIKTMEEEVAIGLIYAPKSGRLGTIDSPLGMRVTANETLLATLGNIDPLVVHFEVSTEEARLLSAADDLKVSLKFSDGTDYPLDGTIKISNDTKAAEAYFDNPDELLVVGTSAQIQIGGVKTKALLIPESAIEQRENGDFVFVVGSNKKAAVKKISLGDKLGTYFIVKDGLKAGDSVIVGDLTNLREGTPLKFRE